MKAARLPHDWPNVLSFQKLQCNRPRARPGRFLSPPNHFWSVQTANENGNYRIVRLHAIGAENRRKDRRKSISCPRRQWVDSSLLKTPLNTFQLGFLFVFHRMKEKRRWKEPRSSNETIEIESRSLAKKKASLDAMGTCSTCSTNSKPSAGAPTEIEISYQETFAWNNTRLMISFFKDWTNALRHVGHVSRGGKSCQTDS